MPRRRQPVFIVSGQNSAVCPLAEKLWMGSKNNCHLLGWARQALPPCKVCGDRTTRAGCTCENVVFVCLFFVMLRGRRAVRSKGITVHYLLSAVMHAPFHGSMLRPASQAGPMHEAAGVGKLVNAALLSLNNEALHV